MIDPRLDKKEKEIILHKGTEEPGSGRYDDFFEPGTYLCRRCQTPLYRGADKFDAHCGWPSFDKEIAGRVKRLTDADGRRIEIQCVVCGAHLGHVFSGEKLTAADTRHCVNSISLHFIPRAEMAEIEMAIFGGGCFWCGEAVFGRLRGVGSVISGYASGAEVVKINFDPAQINYKTLLEIFFVYHDPTTPNRQGNDVGPEYRSIILYDSVGQKAAVEEYIQMLQDSGAYTAPIVTELEAFTDFQPAEDEHHHYYALHPERAYCQLVISPKLKKITEKFGKLLR